MSNEEEARPVVHSALCACAFEVRPLGAGSWAFALAEGEQTVVASLTEDWLSFRAVLPQAGPPFAGFGDGAWQVLTRNARLSGGVRFALPPGEARLSVRAEAPLSDGTDAAACVARICAGLRSALELRHEETPTAAPQAGIAELDLTGLCAETGWPYRVRGGNAIAVQLDVPEPAPKALLARDPVLGVVASARLAPECDSLPAGVREALGVLMLRAGGAVRTVRPAADEEGEPRFEVVLPDAPAAADLAHAFAALSVAWRLAGREAAVLACDERLATLYVETTFRPGEEPGTWNPERGP
jgi:hypothetical protein